MAILPERVRTTRISGWENESVGNFLSSNGIAENGLVISFQNERGLLQAAQLATVGKAFAGHNCGVCFIAGDASFPSFINEVVRIKGDRRMSKPMGTCFDAKTFVDMVDLSQIPPPLQAIFSDPKRLEDTFGSLTFLRVQIKKEAVEKYNLPDAVLSRGPSGELILQNWLTKGSDEMSALGRAMNAAGVRIPAISSLNKSGQGEIVHQDEGILFARDNDIPLFLYDPHFPPHYEQEVQDSAEYAVGSNPVLSIDTLGIHIVREGFQRPVVWTNHIAAPLGIDVTNTATSAHRYPQLLIPQEFIDTLSRSRNPRVVRMGILRYMQGERADHIIARLTPKPQE